VSSCLDYHRLAHVPLGAKVSGLLLHGHGMVMNLLLLLLGSRHYLKSLELLLSGNLAMGHLVFILGVVG
jgi:hypothetical protein